MSDPFDGFAVLEEAALTMLDVPDEAAFLEFYRAHLRSILGQTNLSLMRGVVGRVASNLDQL